MSVLTLAGQGRGTQEVNSQKAGTGEWGPETGFEDEEGLCKGARLP